MLSNKKPILEKFLEPLVGPLHAVNPNIFTLIGSIPPLLFFVFVIKHMYLWALVAFFGNIIDSMDGMIARKYKKVSKFGGFLDSTLDRMSDFFMITAFSFGGIVRWEIVAPLFLFSYLISYTRSRGELASGNSVKFNIGIIERTERLLFILVALFARIIVPNALIMGFNISEIILIVLAVMSLFTFLQRVEYAYRKL